MKGSLGTGEGKKSERKVRKREKGWRMKRNKRKGERRETKRGEETESNNKQKWLLNGT